MLEKISALPKKAKIMVTTAMMMCMTSAIAFADEGLSTGMEFTVTNLKSIISAVTGIVNVGTIIPMLVAILGVSVVFAFMWFAIRKGVNLVWLSIRKGKVRL